MAKKILIVDDDETIRTNYVDIFNAENFDVIEAVDGLEGLAKATEENPEVIITGIIMPRMDGFTLIQELKKNVATSSIPVFINSHMGREEDNLRAKDLEVRDFFVQGMVTPKQVVERVKAVFSPTGYKLKFNVDELDAPKIANDFHFKKDFSCPECSETMTLELEILDIGKHIFSAKFVCPKCGSKLKSLQ